MKLIGVIFVTMCHALLFFSLIGLEGELLLADFSSEGLTEQVDKSPTVFPKYPHQSEEYVIATIESDWIFPSPAEIPPSIVDEIKTEPVVQIEPIPQPVPSPVPEPQKTIPIQKPKAPHKQVANSTQSKKGTGAGNRDAIGQGSGRNKTDGPAGFINGNSNQTILNNIQRCYPLISRKRGEEGLAVVRIHVDQNGNRTRTELIRSTNFARLDKCALEAVQSLQAKPKIVNGKNTMGYFDQSIRFRLN